jgi:hypothetical protein
MSRWLRLTRLAVIATVALASPAFSDVLDQNQPTPIGGMWRMAAVEGSGLMGATFTAGIAGNLSRLELGLARVGNPGAVTVKIYTTDAGGLPLQYLGSVSVPSSPMHAYQDDFDFPLYSIDVSSLQIRMQPGTRYGYALNTTVNDGVSNYLMVAGTEADVYPEGSYYVTGAQGMYIYPQHDGVFRTWVDAAVPTDSKTWGAVKALYR